MKTLLLCVYYRFAENNRTNRYTRTFVWCFIGIIAVPAGLVGLLLGGYIVKRFDLKMRGILRLVIGIHAMLMFLVLVFLLRCENVDFAGVSVTYDGAAMTR